MEERKNNKKTYAFIGLGVLGAIVITLGITYAYWRLTREQTNENVVTTACLDVDIESQQDDINLPKAYPISDTDAESLVPFKFTIHNKCEDNASFQINLESMSKNDELEIPEAQRLNPKYLKFKLNEVDQNGIIRLLTGSKEEDTTKVTPTITDAYDAHKLMSGYLEPNGSKNFEFRLWMDGEITAEEVESMNKTFVSKISVTSTYLEEGKIPPTVELALSVCEKDITASITGEANGEKSIEKYEYKIDEEAWQDGSEVNELTNQSEGKHTIKARVTDNKGIVSEEVEQQIEIIDKEPEMVEIAGIQVPIATCNNGLYKVEHNDLSELGSEWNKTEYRYAGVNYTDGETPYVHNYVEFNGEKWRIIGLVNVKTATGVEQRVKIIRTIGISGQKAFGEYAWDRDSSSSYTNNWTTSKLKDMLNGIYYNSSNGECYKGNYGIKASQSECDFSGEGELTKGLDEEARQMIDSEVIWNIGGWNTSKITADTMYEKERETKTGSSNTYPAEWTSENDETYHKGIGLMYPSDYGYAVGGSVRNTCLSNTLYVYDKYNCYANDWLKVSSGYQWLLSPYSSDSDFAFFVNFNGRVDTSTVYTANKVFPVGYLLPSVTIYDGDGTFDNPFLLQNAV